MKKLLPVVLGVGLVFGFSATDSVDAAAKSYKNCKELNVDYKGGIAISSSVKNKGGKTKYKPTVSKAFMMQIKVKIVIMTVLLARDRIALLGFSFHH